MVATFFPSFLKLADREFVHFIRRAMFHLLIFLKQNKNKYGEQTIKKRAHSLCVVGTMLTASAFD